MANYLASIFGTEQDKVNCSFYYKIGACRHGDRCSRKHVKPSYSQTILLPNLIPIAVSIASLYMGFGAKTLHAPFKAATRWLRETSIPPTFKRGLKDFMGNALKGLVAAREALVAGLEKAVEQGKAMGNVVVTL